MAERVTNTIYIDGNGVVKNDGDYSFPAIVIDLDRYRIGPRTPDSPSEQPALPTASPSPPPLSERHYLDQEVTNIEAVPEQKITHRTWVNDLRDVFERQNITMSFLMIYENIF